MENRGTDLKFWKMVCWVRTRATAFLLLIALVLAWPTGGYADNERLGLVSVIMTTYNRESLVLDAVRSILDQTYTHWELIVVDDASTDDSWTLLQESVHDPRVRLYRLSQNVGMYAGSNYALRHLVRGEYVTWQDSDDRSHPERLERQVRHIEQYNLEAVSIAHSNPNNGQVSYSDFPVAQGAVRVTLPIRRWSRHPEATHFSMTRGLFRTRRVIEMGGFNGHYRISMDSDLVDRFLKLHPTGGVPGEPLYFYEPRADSLTVAAATAFGSRARTRVTAGLLARRCASNLLWNLGLTRAFEKFQKSDFYYPTGLTVESASLAPVTR